MELARDLCERQDLPMGEPDHVDDRGYYGLIFAHRVDTGVWAVAMIRNVRMHVFRVDHGQYSGIDRYTLEIGKHPVLAKIRSAT